MRFIPRRVYTEGEPTFRELADEARDMAAYASSGGASFEAVRHTWRAWQLSQFYRWGYAGSWDLSVFLWRVGVIRIGLALFVLPAAALALSGILRSGTDVENYLWGLGIVAVFACGIGIIIASFIWHFLRSLALFAQLYRRKRLELDHHLRSAAGTDGWRAELAPDGGWQLVRVESSSSTA